MIHFSPFQGLSLLLQKEIAENKIRFVCDFPFTTHRSTKRLMKTSGESKGVIGYKPCVVARQPTDRKKTPSRYAYNQRTEPNASITARHESYSLAVMRLCIGDRGQGHREVTSVANNPGSWNPWTYSPDRQVPTSGRLPKNEPRE